MTDYLELGDYRAYAAAVLGVDVRSVPFRDEGVADAALHAIQPVFGHDEYPGVPIKTAVLLYKLARAHPLADGNKRTATQVALAFAGLNGHRLDADLDELEDLIVDGAAGEIDQGEFVTRFAPLLLPRL